MNIRCIVIDDEPLAVQLLADYIQQVPFLSLEAVFFFFLYALAYLHHTAVELIFLDINMPKLTGMELVPLLGRHQKIIFTTAYTQYAIESYEKNAVDYLLKPITFERFMQAVTKVLSLSKETHTPDEPTEPANPSIFVKTGKAIVQLSLAEVDYIEGLKDYVVFVNNKERYLVYKRMKELESTLPSFFQRIHHSYIVNARKIEKIEDNHIHIQAYRLPISTKYRDSLMSYIHQKLL